MKHLLLIVALVGVSSPLCAQINLGTPFTDHAVLQRGRAVPVWGTATAGNEIVVSFADQTVMTRVGSDGRWRVDLAPLVASKEGRLLRVEESESGWFGSRIDAVDVRDVLVGEVWIASGQSNMACPLWGDDERFRDASGALVREMTQLPNIRYSHSNQKWSVTPRPIVAPWRTLTAENLRDCPLSAVAFYFVRELYLALDVPIGVVNASVGGTSIDAWTPRCGYEGCDPILRETAAYQPVENGKFPLKHEHDWDWTAPIFEARQQPTVLWNANVDAWCPMALRGVIWYQGCANNGQAPSYAARMHALYNGWARRFENPDLSFRFVQLAPFYHTWFELVQAQAKFAAEEPHASMVVTADVGNIHDVHPNRKEIVAKRLAAQALRLDYGFAISETDSPVLQRACVIDGGKAELIFDHVLEWYVYAPDRSLTPAFELCGADGVWHLAKIANLVDAKVVGSRLLLSSENVSAPTRARYMGKKGDVGTLYNQMSLPLGPFETTLLPRE